MASNPPRLLSEADALHQELERARAQVAASAAALRAQVAQRTDWREWVRRHPAWVLSGAFALGFLIGSRSSRRSREPERLLSRRGKAR